MSRVEMPWRLGAALLIMLLPVSRAGAQTLQGHGFFDVGATRFTASQSFEALFGSATGIVFGGGGGVELPQKIFIDGRISRFQKDAHRVFVDNGNIFDLGITDTIAITPFDLTAGYRFGRRRDSVRPYAGGGISWYRYSETDQFATAAEQVAQTFTGFHLLGGAEFRVSKWVGIAGEAAWASVPNGLGQETTSVAAGFDETDLGGITFRAKIVIGR
jgi:hypothetical protein